MKVDDCYQLGEVIKTHGISGELIIHLDVDIPSEYRDMESLFLLLDQELTPFFVEQIQINGERARVKFEDINTVASASALVHSPAYLPLSMLPPLAEGGYYFHQLIGLDVYEQDSQFIGTVREIIDFNENRLLSIEKEKKELLMPMNSEIIKNVDIEAKKIIVKSPEGLVDFYFQ